jgi:hypothetical protein
MMKKLLLCVFLLPLNSLIPSVYEKIVELGPKLKNNLGQLIQPENLKNIVPAIEKRKNAFRAGLLAGSLCSNKYLLPFIASLFSTKAGLITLVAPTAISKFYKLYKSVKTARGMVIWKMLPEIPDQTKKWINKQGGHSIDTAFYDLKWIDGIPSRSEKAKILKEFILVVRENKLKLQEKYKGKVESTMTGEFEINAKQFEKELEEYNSSIPELEKMLKICRKVFNFRLDELFDPKTTAKQIISNITIMNMLNRP